MSPPPGSRIITQITLESLAGVVGQCVNCNEVWGFHCEVNVTGYYCELGAKITQTLLSEDELATSTIGDGNHDQCTPYPFHAGSSRASLQEPSITLLCCRFHQDLLLLLFTVDRLPAGHQPKCAQVRKPTQGEMHDVR